MNQHSIFMKIIAVILTVTMIIGILPMTVFAEEFNETQLMRTVEVESDKKEKSPIVGEVIDKRDENTKVFERRDGSYTAVITSEPIHYEDNGELYGMDYNGTGYFGFVKNLQGDIVSIVPLDSESNVELNIEYDAWGKPIFEESSLGAAFVKAMIMAVTNVGYRGYFYDFETGLYYLRSRYYDPETGRFINADDTDYLGYDGTPLSLNLFAYCENNPINGYDPYGTCFLNSNGTICHDNWEYNKVYSGQKAVNYAKKWWNGYNNSYYRYYTNGDCTNFVSQCLFAGGLLMNNKWFSFRSKNKPSNNKPSKWYKGKFTNYYYCVSNAWSLAKELYNYLKDRYYVRTYGNTDRGRCYYKRDVRNKIFKPGDVAFFENQKNGIHHAVIIGKVTQTDCYYYAHSSARGAGENATFLKVLKNEKIHIVSVR